MSWRRLLPGAIAMGVGLIALRVAAAIVLSTTLTSHFVRYGALGIVFVVLSWLVAFSVVMLGGALLGVVVYERRRRHEEAAEAAAEAAATDDTEVSPPAGDPVPASEDLGSGR